MNKQAFLSTDLFKNKSLPSCIREHVFFHKTTIEVGKIFPTIGLPNFKEGVKIDKCFVDVKKEDGYVFRFVNVIHQLLIRAAEDLRNKADTRQFSITKEKRAQEKDKIINMFSFVKAITEVAESIDPYVKENLDGVVRTDSALIELKLHKTVAGPNPEKPLFKKDIRLHKVFGKIKEQCLEYDVGMIDLEQTAEFKVFSKENIPNKELSIVFSSDGPDGAWDLATMSVRGIKSCQRWDGEYPSCLVGSILSKFVGIIYLTSGVQADPYPDAQKGNIWKDLGTKMMRRCVVRYAIDAEDNQPYILLDKMYPEPDKEVLAAFIGSLQSKTKCKVQYATEITVNRIKHMYTPYEKIRNELSGRNLSYHDIALKTEQDFNLFLLTNNKEQIDRDIKSLKFQLSLNISRGFERDYANKNAIDPECYAILHNMRITGGFPQIADGVANLIVDGFQGPSVDYSMSSKDFYTKYISEFISSIKDIIANNRDNISVWCSRNMSRVLNLDVFQNYLEATIISSLKNEISN